MPVSVSPISGALFITMANVHYDWEAEGKSSAVMFPNMSEGDANRMAEYLASVTANTENVTSYTDIRVAMVQFTEIPDDYNSIPPLV